MSSKKAKKIIVKMATCYKQLSERCLTNIYFLSIVARFIAESIAGGRYGQDTVNRKQFQRKEQLDKI